MFAAAGIEIVKIPPRAPRANAYAERWVRTVGSERLDWTLIWSHQHLHRVLNEYLRRHNSVRPHRCLGLQPPIRAGGLALVKAPPTTNPAIQRIDVLGGLIHEYRRAA